MASAISFGDSNAGFQAGIINGDVHNEYHQYAPPGELNGFKVTGANDDPALEDPVSLLSFAAQAPFNSYNRQHEPA
jgi:hypothetical protein